MMRILSFAAVVVLCTSLGFAENSVSEVSAQFRHAENDVQREAHGGIGIRRGPDFHRFSVWVEGVREDGILRVLLGSGGEEFSEVGTLPAGHSVRELNRTTREGGELPLGVEDVSTLIGRAVRIVDGENHLILVGSVPHFEEAEPTPLPEPISELIARATLMRPEGSQLGESRGVVVARRGGSHGDALRIEVARLASETFYTVYALREDDAILAGDFRTNGEGGANFAREADVLGGPLSDHLPSITALAGRRVEVRDLEGHVVLYGHVPEVAAHDDVEPVHEHSEFHDESSGAEVHVDVDIHPEAGHERFRMEMRDLPRERHEPAKRPQTRRGARARADVYLADENGDLQPLDSVRIGSRGRALLRYTTRRGGRLPLGAATLRELAGRAFEVRVGDVRVARGSLPTL